MAKKPQRSLADQTFTKYAFWTWLGAVGFFILEIISLSAGRVNDNFNLKILWTDLFIGVISFCLMLIFNFFKPIQRLASVKGLRKITSEDIMREIIAVLAILVFFSSVVLAKEVTKNLDAENNSFTQQIPSPTNTLLSGVSLDQVNWQNGVLSGFIKNDGKKKFITSR